MENALSTNSLFCFVLFDCMMFNEFVDRYSISIDQLIYLTYQLISVYNLRKIKMKTKNSIIIISYYDFCLFSKNKYRL
jgi:hypothetical protein